MTVGSPKYLQRSAHIPSGREGLVEFIKGMPTTLKYEPGEPMPGDEIVR